MIKDIKLWLIMIAAVLCMNTAVMAVNVNSEINTASQKLVTEVSNPTVASIGGEWAVIALARGGYNVPQGYYDKYYDNLLKVLKEYSGELHSRKYTEYSRVILALTAIDKNPSNVGGYDLLSRLLEYDNVIWQGVNGGIFALIALDSGNYYSDNKDIRDKYISYILSKQNTDGGFGLSKDSDVDITAMAVQALYRYMDRDDVKSTVDRAINYLSAVQNENGGFSSWQGENSEGVSQVIVALCSMGIDPATDSRFVKSGGNPVSNLLTYGIDGGYKHIPEESGYNIMATEQAAYALAAYKRYTEGKSGLYDMKEDTKEENIDWNKLGDTICRGINIILSIGDITQ